MCDKELLVGYLYDDMDAGRAPDDGSAPGLRASECRAELKGLPRDPHDR